MYLTLPATLSAPCEKMGSGAASPPVASRPLKPTPPVAVMDPSERVPSAATFRATIELFAALVMKYIAFAFVAAVVELEAAPPFPFPFPFFPPPFL